MRGMHATTFTDREWWVFTKAEQALWVAKPDPLTLIVVGPRSRARYGFKCAAAAEDFQVTLAEQLSSAGWLLAGKWTPSHAVRGILSIRGKETSAAAAS